MPLRKSAIMRRRKVECNQDTAKRGREIQDSVSSCGMSFPTLLEFYITLAHTHTLSLFLFASGRNYAPKLISYSQSIFVSPLGGQRSLTWETARDRGGKCMTKSRIRYHATDGITRCGAISERERETAPHDIAHEHS